MKKALLAVLSAALLITVTQPAQAQDERVLAIIDSAINSNNFPSIIHEVCFTSKEQLVTLSSPVLCPNGTSYMEGKGSAGIVKWPASPGNGIYHGSTMLRSALALNPNIKIVFIRISNTDANGSQNGLSQHIQSVVEAIKWTSINASKYSIDAVSVSQSALGFDVATSTRAFHDRCKDATTINAVSQLNANNIPTFAATGNDASSTLVGFPACVPGVIGVGTVVDQKSWVGETATNRGPGIDIVAGSNNSGSSVSTAIASSRYVGKNTYKTYSEYINSLPKQSIKYCIRPVGKTSGCSGIFDTIPNLPVSLN